MLGLNKNLDEVRGRVLGTEPLPSICKIFVEVRREESNRKIMLSGEIDGMATERSALVAREPKREIVDGMITVRKHTRETC